MKCYNGLENKTSKREVNYRIYAIILRYHKEKRITKEIIILKENTPYH